MWGGLEEAATGRASRASWWATQAKAPQLFGKNGARHVLGGQGPRANPAPAFMSVAEAEGNTKMRERPARAAQSRFESWFDGKGSTYFVQTPARTFVGVPQEYNSINGT